MTRSASTSALSDTPHAHSRFGRLTLLCTLMFLEHAIFGAWIPVMPLHLKQLGFSPLQIGNLFGILSLAGLAAPWIGGHLADRVISAQALLAIGHAAGAILFWLAASATDYWSILLLLLAASFIYLPTFTVTNHIVFRHLADPLHEFGKVRLWGTASWVAMSAIMGLWLARPAWLPFAQHAQLSDCLRLAALMSAALAAFAFFVPRTPPEAADPEAGRFAFIDVLKMLRDRSFRLLLVISFLLSLINPFIYPVGAAFLQSLGISEAGVAPLLSLGQAGEVFAFLLLGPILRRIGFKAMFLVGIAAFILRFAAWSIGQPLALVIAAIPLHGISYAYFIGLGQTYTNKIASRDVRATAQALHYFASAGIGGWIGNWMAAAACLAFTMPGPTGVIAVQYGYVFMIPLLIALISGVVFSLGFHSARPDPETPVVASNPEV